ncbi:MAG: SusC/RagA family TonB-linked outer membrane protein [Flavobacteriales bacterium]|nr:SusC/RagA family TonB-linked outer membrane protein [Flavobacteriales bacterium]
MKIILFILFSGISAIAFSQSNVSGVVTDAADGQPIPGVQVLAKTIRSGANTDLDGKYSINLPKENFMNDSLTFSMLGFKRITMAIAGRSTINVALEQETVELDAAVVTAIGIKKEKKKLGYAITDVNGDELKKSNETNVVNALNGKVAGVQVTSSSGSPGASSSIVIRGYSSIDGSNQPLFVIDGVPIDNSYRGSNLTDQGNRALDINPDDIENISVLKGGAATALYGYRAGNGVVMITTKKGKAGKSAITFSSSTLFDKVNKLPEKQTRWSQGTTGEFVDDSQFSWGEEFSGENFADQAFDFFNTGVTLNNNLAFEGGDEFSSYHLSLGNTRQSGIIPNTDFKRSNIKLNASQTLWGKLKMSGLANYTTSKANRGQRGSNLSGVMLGLMRASSSYDFANGMNDAEDVEAAYINPDGTQRTFFSNYDNPYWSVNKNGNYNEVDRLIGALEFSLPLGEHWSVINRTGVDWYSDRIHEYWDKQSNEFKDLGGRIFVDNIHFRSLNNDFVVNYNTMLSEKLEFTALVGHNIYDVKEQEAYMDGVGFVIDNYYDISNVSTADLLVDDNFSNERTVSGYGNINFGYDRFLYLDITARNDWFSTLPSQNNSVFYPSVSSSFVFTEVMKVWKKLDFGKLRVSYAETGNGAPAPYLTSFYYEQSGQPQGQLGFAPSSFVFNPDLKPERLKSFEAGTDLRFFKNRLQLDLTYYNNNTVDQILFIPVPASSGYLETVFNAGNIRNSGWEIMLNSTIKEGNGKEKLSWNSSVNFTRNRNEVESLSEGTDLIALPSYGLASTQSVVAVGEAFGVLYGGAWQRDESGNILIDNTGYPIKDSERKLLGNPNPDFTIGWRNDIGWKNFSLSFLWDIRMGGYMHNGTKAVMLFHGTHADTENRDSESVIWEGVNVDSGEANTISIPMDENFYSLYSLQYVSEEVIEEVNWFRLRDLSFTYNFPKKVFEKLKMDNLSLSFTSRNLFLWTSYSGIDPETNLSGAANSIGRDYFNSPNTKSFGFALKAAF